MSNNDQVDIAQYCSEADSKALAAHVVVYRLLHINKELAKACMQELTKRANTGDDFDYEQYIDEKLSTMPKPIDPEKQSILNRVLSNSELRNK